MQQLQNKRIVLGVTGGIAAYKSADLIRRLTKLGADVRVVMTAAACEFITPLTLQALSHNPVHLDLLDPTAEAGMGHIELARWADKVLVAPATANFMARLCNGHANDLLTTLCLATQAPIYLAPAMNQGMWLNSLTQQNCLVLQERGITLFGPSDGVQACGDVGPGRMLEPQLIIEHLIQTISTNVLTGINLMVTAGPTQESIDPVRYISNRSSGKMGYALAEAAAEAGATVRLVSGPVYVPVPDRVNCTHVISAQEMYEAVHQHIAKQDIFIGCAAVSDYRSEKIANNKLKKNPDDPNETMILRLIRNPDIIVSVTALDHAPFVVGFAAESKDVVNYAVEKLKRKKLNLIIANDISHSAIGFGSDDNQVTVLTEQFEETLPLTSKKVLSQKLIQIIKHNYNAWNIEKEKKHYEKTENHYS